MARQRKGLTAFQLLFFGCSLPFSPFSSFKVFVVEYLQVYFPNSPCHSCCTGLSSPAPDIGLVSPPTLYAVKFPMLGRDVFVLTSQCLNASCAIIPVLLVYTHFDATFPVPN